MVKKVVFHSFPQLTRFLKDSEPEKFDCVTGASLSSQALHHNQKEGEEEGL